MLACRTLTRPAAITAAVLLLCLGGAAAADLPAAEKILEQTGVTGGLVVHLGCEDGELAADLGADERFLVQGLAADAESVDEARETIQERGLYGRVSVMQCAGPELPYVDNLADLLIVEDPGETPIAEVMRVLSPGGVAYVADGDKWAVTTKSWPEEIDQWTHHLHGPDGNPVAQDTVVGPPRHFQWIAGPLWLRSHDTDSSISSVVTANGRIFSIADGAPIGTPGNHPLPDKWQLVARDAFNGKLLWKRPISVWGWREWKTSWYTARPDNLPANLPRRLVADGDRVYTTLGYHDPVSRIDAATGETLHVYANTEDTREILLHQDTLVLTVMREGRLALVVLDAETGALKWESAPLAGTAREYFSQWQRRGEETPVDPVLNPATDGDGLFAIDGQEIAAFDLATGAERWRTKVEETEPATSVGTLIVADGVVLHADRDELIALAADSGNRLWSRPQAELGWLWFHWKDIFVIDDTVWAWSAELQRQPIKWAAGDAQARWPSSLDAFDLRTGELKRKLDLGGIYITGHHHRCYRNKATTRYILTSRRGTEFVDLDGGVHTVDNWVRGTCHLGMMPANGLQYAPSHPCACYIYEKLNGFMALAAERPSAAERDTDGPQLLRGPAFGESRTASNADDWPTFRHDGLRTGVTTSPVAGAIKPDWEAGLDGRLSPPIAADNRVFVASIDAHQVIALDAPTGEELWRFTAGARVDSPPTYYNGTVLFGSRDGWVYCLAAEDGEVVWRFRGAPRAWFIGAFDQLESAWPIHGSVLVQGDRAYFAAGRSSHLDHGIRLYALDATTGELIRGIRLEGPRHDVTNIEDNANLPQGTLPDILQGDGERVYMRNLAFDADLEQLDAGGPRISAPGGMLDDTNFMRIPWRYGQGPTWGRVLAYNEKTLFISRMFDSLKALDPDHFFAPAAGGYSLEARSAAEQSVVMVANSDSLSPAGKPLTVEAWVKPDAPNGAIIARGGVNWGYALVLRDGHPRFVVRHSDTAHRVVAEVAMGDEWTHLAGVLAPDRKLLIYVDGKLAASADGPELLPNAPGQATEIGADLGTGAGEYESPFAFNGTIDEPRITHRALTADEIAQRAAAPEAVANEDATALHFSFDAREAIDDSGNENNGRTQGTEVVDGVVGKALRFRTVEGAQWEVRFPIQARALVPTRDVVFAAGAPDVIDPDDPLGAYEGRKGAVLVSLDAKTGERVGEWDLASPPVYNGIIASRGRLFISQEDGTLLCMKGQP